VSKQVITRIRVDDVKTQAALEEHARSVSDVSRDPILQRRTVTITLVNATTLKIKHGLGRTFESYSLSAPIGATAVGLIEEIAGADPATEIWLQANGMGATVTVRVTVW
jgi:hypothetical protein